MSLLRSLIFGSNGSYNICGVNVKFASSGSPIYNFEGAGLIARIVMKCFSSDLFRLVTLSYAHVFAHEMSHAGMEKICTNPRELQVNCYTDACMGGFSSIPTTNSKGWKKTLMLVAGPMGDVAFSICQMIAAKALKRVLPWPLAMAFGSGGVLWMIGELFYACVSVAQNDFGDFGRIKSHGPFHLAAASTALVGGCALGILAVANVRV